MINENEDNFEEATLDNEEGEDTAQVTADGKVLPTREVKKSASITVGNAVRDAHIGGLNLSPEALATKEKLAKQPKVSIYIPLDPGERPGAYRSVTINGYRFEIKKNVMVEVPRAVAKLIQDAYNIESASLNNHPLNLNNQPESSRKALE